MPFIIIKTQPIFYVQNGSGLPLIFLHGAGGSHQHWGLQLRDSSISAHKIAFDMAGHGRSTSQAPKTIAAYAEHTIEILDTLGLQHAALIGHSMGGAIALQIALEQPQRVTHLAMISSGAHLPVLPDLMQSFKDDPVATVAYIASKSYGPQAPADIRAASLTALRRTDTTLLYNDFYACDHFDLRHRLPDLRCPTLIMYGTADELVAPQRSLEIHAAIPQTTLVALDAIGHMIMLEAPNLVSQAISTLIQSKGYPFK